MSKVKKDFRLGTIAGLLVFLMKNANGSFPMNLQDLLKKIGQSAQPPLPASDIGGTIGSGWHESAGLCGPS
jgi:hypothetical protein